MLHIIHILIMQVITLPSNITDLAQWLLLPAVMGVAATFFGNLFLQALPQYKQFVNAVRFAVYILIALISVWLAQIPPSVLQVYQPLFVAIMAAIAAFIGDNVLQAAGKFTSLAVATVLGIGMRLAFGKDAAHTSFKSIIAHG